MQVCVHYRCRQYLLQGLLCFSCSMSFRHDVGNYRLLVLVSIRDLESMSCENHNIFCICWQGTSSTIKHYKLYLRNIVEGKADDRVYNQRLKAGVPSLS